MRSTRALAYLAGLTLIACAGGPGGAASVDPKVEPIGKVQQPLEALIPMQDCGEVEQFLRGRFVDTVNRQVDAAIKQISNAESYACGGYYGDDDDDYSNAPSGSSSSGSSGSMGNSSGGSTGGAGAGDSAESTSSTNNQTAGVDEADFIKNDGKYLYLASNDAFRIVQAWPAESMSEVAKITLDGIPKKLFVEGDRAFIYVSVAKASNPYASNGSWGGSSEECTYGYDCVPSGDGTMTKLLVFDIADRRAPKQVREVTLSGSLLSARRIGNAVHTVVVDAPPSIEGVQNYPENLYQSCDNIQDKALQRASAIAAWEKLRAKNLELIARADVMKNLPQVTENGASALAACSGYFRPSVAEGATLTSLVSLDIAGGAPTIATVVSDPGVVYASETGLYLSVPHTKSEGNWYASMADETQASVIHKFRIGATPEATGYEASGIVKGRVLNQFALDEFDGNLRVATTTGHAPDPETHSTMSILERQSGALVLTGKVDHIAPTEDIRSVRFDGARGFVVTFKKTDPLYAFDLADKTAPRIAGELKIPGFSTYMHMMDATHLLTIGYDADDQGDFAWFKGVMLQIFDVSDMANPKLAHKELIGTRGSSSEALANHLAFNYYAPKNLLAIPMTVCEGGGDGGSYGDTMTFSGLMVFDVTTTGGFAKRGQVAHPNSTSGDGYQTGSCGNWWANATSEVKRSVIMDDVVYSVSDRRVKANRLTNLGADIATVSLQ